MFELELIRCNEVMLQSPDNPSGSALDRKGSQGSRSILLKGQMRFIQDINAIIFLCSPL